MKHGLASPPFFTALSSRRHALADIRVNQLPLATGPTAPMQSDVVPIDGATTRKTTIQSLVEIGRPVASQAEALAGIDSVKVMTALTVQQKIDSLLLGSASQAAITAFATAAQGVKADALPSYASGGKGQTVVVKPDGSGFELSGTQTGKFFAEDGARIVRLADRVFMGGAVAHNGTDVDNQPDWLTQKLISYGRTFGFGQVSQVYLLAGETTGGEDRDLNANALVSAAKTSSLNLPGPYDGNAIGVLGVGINDSTDASAGAWGLYGEGFKENGSIGPAYAEELDSINFGPPVAIDPFTQSDEQTVGQQMAAGAEFTGANSSSAAYNVRNNGANFLRGMVWGNDAIAGTNGTDGGRGPVFQFATGHSFQYFYGAGQVSWEVWAGTGLNGDFIFNTAGGGALAVGRIKETVGMPWISWGSAAARSDTGSFASSSTSFDYKVTNGDIVHVQIRVIITTDGTASPNYVEVDSPFNSSTNFGQVSMVGKQVNPPAKGCTVQMAANSNKLQIRLSDTGGYPGGSGQTLLIGGWFRKAP